MEFILSLIKTLSAVSVITAALYIIMPSGALEGSFKYAMGIFALSAVVSLIISSPADYTMDFNIDKSKSAITANANELNTKTIKLVIEKLLNDNNINFKKVEIITNKLADDNINITKAIIYTNNQTDLEKAKIIIKNQIGITAVGGY